MALSSKHPAYTEMFPHWEKMRDSFDGEDAIKDGGTKYLPATHGQNLDGMEPGGLGLKNYMAYKMRAVYPSYVEEGIEEMIGAMHQKPPTIKLPKALEPLMDSATVNGESLAMLLRRINEEQLIVGRIGLLLDFAENQSPIPHIASYGAETIFNWDDGARSDPVIQALNLVVLCETEPERTAEMEYVDVEKYRVLVLGSPEANEAAGVYRQATFRETVTFSEDGLFEPTVRGKTLDRIPFIFVNASDLLPTPQKPPLIKLANLCLAIYRGEADYRNALYMQGQDTLVVIGGEEGQTFRVGTGAGIFPPIGGDAKYIGANSSGLPEMRQAIANDRDRAAQMAGQLLDSTSRMKESGIALSTRVAAQTVTLHQIALTGAEGMKKILQMAAIWVGANPEEVIVHPNIDFAGAKLTPSEYLQLSQAKSEGLPLSDESLHQQLKKDEYTVMEFVDEMKLIAEERAQVLDDLTPPNPQPDNQQ